MRRKINRQAICSSNNYKESKRIHLDMLQEKHNHFKEMAVSGEISIDVPTIKNNRVTSKFKTIRVFGKEMKVSIEEFNTHCKEYV